MLSQAPLSILHKAEPEPRRSRSRAALAHVLPLLAACGVLLVSGCHHASQVAYGPGNGRKAPPPIAPDTSVETQPETRANAARPARPRPPMSPEIQPTTGFDDTSGPPVFTEVGKASWYGPPYHNHQAADGTIFDQNAMTAAHRTLPMGSTLRVTNIATGESVIVRVNDRGPFVPGRVLDLSMAAAKAIGVWRPGTAMVKVEAFAHPTADPAGRWCVQIGAFLDPADSLSLQAMLREQYKSAKVIEFTGPTGHWVRINPAPADLHSANEIARSLQSPDPNALPYVVRLN